MTTRFEKHKIIVAAGLFLVFFLMLDLGVGYILSEKKILRVRAEQERLQTGTVQSNDNSPRTFSTFYHHGLKPGFSGRLRWGKSFYYEAHTDSLGLRARASQKTELRSDRHRVLILGDSFTEGVGVPFSETFAGRIADTLESRENAEVHNAGVISYSPKLYYLKTLYLWEIEGMRFEELWVFIDSSDVLDELVYSTFVPRGFPVPPTLYDAIRYERAVPEPTFLKRSLLYRIFAQSVFGRDPWGDPDTYRKVDTDIVVAYYRDLPTWIHDDRQFEEWGREGLASARFHMAALARFCAQNQVDLGIVVYPRPTELVERARASRNEAAWEEFAEDRQIPFLSLYPTFLALEPEAAEELFIPGDAHWTAEGHALVAQKWLEFRASGD